MREYDYRVQHLKGKDNHVADHLSRPVQLVVRHPEETWLGLEREQFAEQQRVETVWAELITYLMGGAIPKKQLPKATLDTRQKTLD